VTDLIKAKSKLYWALMDADVEDALKNGIYLQALMADPDIKEILNHNEQV
jgi:hypothetical protein